MPPHTTSIDTKYIKMLCSTRARALLWLESVNNLFLGQSDIYTNTYTVPQTRRSMMMTPDASASCWSIAAFGLCDAPCLSQLYLYIHTLTQTHTLNKLYRFRRVTGEAADSTMMP